jgi:Protein of unknown function (DUF3830)
MRWFVARYFIFTYPGEGVTARAELLEDKAPKTVETLWKHAPYKGDASHAIYSGTAVGLLFDPSIIVPMENATNYVQTCDVMFTHYEPNTRYDHPDGVSEIYWAYDRYCRPIMPGCGMLVYPNVFGRMVDDYQQFFEASRNIAIAGQRKITITGHTE